MKCQKCGKYDATIHLTEILNGIKDEVYLCKHCGDEYGSFHSIFKNNFDSFFDDFWESPVKHIQPTISSAQTCSNCQSSLTDIQKRGRLGCSECYKTFFDFLQSPLKSIHGSCNYKGKSPKSAVKPDKITQLKSELDRAIESQNFERAAELRDEIKGLEA